MTELDPGLMARVLAHIDGDRIISATGLRDGGAPWLLRVSGDYGIQEMVLRLGSDANDTTNERAATIWADDHGIPAPIVLSDEAPGEPFLVIEPIAGSSNVPVERRSKRLEAIGAIAAKIHAVPAPALPRRLQSVSGVDFVPLWDASDHPMRDRARRAIAGFDPDLARDGFVHGDLWMGNAMWAPDDSLVAVIDWDCAGRGPAGVDLGSARMDAATAYGDGAEDDVLRGWERESHRPADEVARWDVVAALCTPPDMGWFTTAIQQQGRTDLTPKLLVERRDAFLERALGELGF